MIERQAGRNALSVPAAQPHEQDGEDSILTRAKAEGQAFTSRTLTSTLIQQWRLSFGIFDGSAKLRFEGSRRDAWWPFAPTPTDVAQRLEARLTQDPSVAREAPLQRLFPMLD